MRRRMLALVVVGTCLTVTPAVASRGPSLASGPTGSASSPTATASICAAQRLGLISLRRVQQPSMACETPAARQTLPPEPAQVVCGPTAAGINDECPDWVSTPLPDATVADRTNNNIVQSALPGDGLDATQPSVLSPSGATLYSAGTCMGGPCGPMGGVYGTWAAADGVQTGDQPGSHGAVTAAYDAYSGALEWMRTYDAGSKFESATAILATRQSVFTLAEHTDDSWWPTGTYQSQLLAYRHDGKPLWQLHLAKELATSSALDHAGKTIFVGATRVQQLGGGECRVDATASAVVAATGRLIWQSTVPGQPGKCQAQSPAPTGSMYGGTVAANGRVVYLTAMTVGSDWFGRSLVLAGFDARTGAQVIRTDYTPPVTPGLHLLGTGATSCEFGNAPPLLVTPDGRRAFVEDAEVCPQPDGSSQVYALTLAFGTRSGSLMWHAVDKGGAANDDYPWVDHPMTLSPDGRALVVAGASSTASSSSVADGIVTTAYQVSSGKQLWTNRYVYPIHAHQTMCVWCGPTLARTANAIVVSGYMNGGYNEGIPYAQYAPNATVGLDPKTGAQLWVAFDQPFDRTSAAVIGEDLVANPRTRAVYAITGTSQLQSNIAIRVLGYHATN